MSVFEDRAIKCPHCKAENVCNVALSLSGVRAAKAIQAIRDGSFQRFNCTACQREFVADGPLIYIDFERKHWIGVFPRVAEVSWRMLEQQPMDSFRRSMIDFAPKIARIQAEGFTIRTVFGLTALAEKLVCLDAGIDDRLLEALKLDILRSQKGLVFNPDTRPVLTKVTDDTLVFDAWRNDEGREDFVEERVTVPRKALDAIRDKRADWLVALNWLGSGPYIDTGRIMLSGDVIPG